MTFSTHVGLRRYKRLSSDSFRQLKYFTTLYVKKLSDIEGAFNSSDDILIHGRNQQQHDDRLRRARLAEMNVTVNEAKEQVSKSSVQFHGEVLSANGLKIDPIKVKSIIDFVQPETATEVRSFLGKTNYCSRFIKQHADLSALLRKLTLKDKEIVWTKECEDAFKQLKENLSNTRSLAFFDP